MTNAHGLCGRKLTISSTFNRCLAQLNLYYRKLKKDGHHSCFTHINREQREFIKDLRSKSTNDSFVVAQIDFSMNYTLIRQREVQQGFFSQHQVSLFTIHLTIGDEHTNLAIISNYMEHTTAFVHCAQKILVEFIKKNFPLVKKINYVR